MFLRGFKYALLTLIRSKETIFWTLVFPFALCTFMYMAFGNLYETTEKFQTIPVAVIQEKENAVLRPMLDAVSQEGEDQLLKISYVTREKAEDLLEREEIKGIITVHDSVSLKVKENGMDQTILQIILKQMMQYKSLFIDVGKDHPEKISEVVKSINQKVDCFVEDNDLSGNQDNTVNYFYAIFAMTCLFASFAGCEKILHLQANMSSLGQRRSVAGMNKMKLVLADFVACELVQFAIVCILLVYMDLVLGIHLGDKYGALLILLFTGTSWGIMFGILVGTIPRMGEGGKIGFLVSVNLFFCCLSDLMVSGVKDLVEHHIPIANDINPAVLITDSFYALNVYDTYDRFAGNIITLAGMTIVCAVVCYLIVRRNRYASI